MNYNITLNKGRLQAINIPKKPALCFKRKDKCEFEDTDWGECLCEKYYREYDQNLAKAKSEAIDFRPEDYTQISDLLWGLCDVRLPLKEGETYPVPDGFEIEIKAEFCAYVNDEWNQGYWRKYARLVSIKEQKKEEPSELRQLIWRIVVDTFNSKSNNCSDIYNKIIKEEKDIIKLLEK